MEDALAQYKMALDYDPQSKEAIFNMGCCYEQMGDIEQARKYLTKYVHDYPAEPNSNSVLTTLETLKNKKSLFKEEKDSADYFKSTTAEGIALWPRRSMPIKVFIASGENTPGFRKSFGDILMWSFGQWLRGASNYLSLNLVSNEEAADIVCSWTNDIKDLQQGAEQGETHINFRRVKGGKPVLVHASIKLCIVDPLAGGVLSDKVFTELCLHEIGHALGIKGHSPNRNDVMFFATGEIFPLHTLSARDVATINRLYATYQSN
jgi:tetratricopeptide (TPR) repeat protein